MDPSRTQPRVGRWKRPAQTSSVRRRDHGWRAVALTALWGACAGAGSRPGLPPVCPDDAPSACANPAPGFAGQVAPLIGAHCAKCHVSGGMAEMFPFQSYEQVETFAGDIKLQIETCEMPPAAEPALTVAERQTLFGWILCGARND